MAAERGRAGFALLMGAMVLLLLAAMTLAIAVGGVSIAPATVWAILLHRLGLGEAGHWTTGQDAIVWLVRAPRAVLGAAVGASLALVGAALQSVTRNTLADPHLLGVSSGAALGAIVALLQTGLIFGLLTVPLFAFAGALGAMALVLAVTHLTGAQSAGRLILSGVAIGFVLGAFGNLVIFLSDPRAASTAIFWMLGGLGLAQWSQLPYPLAALAGCGGYLLLRAKGLNAATLGDETATTLGLQIRRFRFTIFIVCALLTGTAVAFSGIIAFVGLMSPHIVRLCIGGDYRRVLPASALFGAIFLVLSDVAARCIMPPQDIPLGVLTSFVGGIVFILLMARNRRLAGD
ncbi:FecCD family ABC transporter permease [Acidimangrovimonas sediminis]|uniref:FecCD family ABC transporter permease n=1 Tax=Acidimangrovimonas sediminis TaxID=2056283 RepID=UPI001E296935|nr:iron ABC transporter permease [Acidimangrovimonas sediminis]